ncbi:MFS transporter [Akkermansiaceae bacterium]|nr:MFS transporter [Akkermansiaceae bacterium]
MSDETSKNPGRYVCFTTLYNARAYYPVLAILFLDLGLTLDQYVMLNLVWAATIFLFEVPSGALADTLGRKTLLVTASVLMIVEMSCLLFAPKDGGWILFSLCVANRLLSGLSEAAASGADEALAYDSLPEENREQAWDDVLAKAMRYRAAGFVIAMIAGGFLYDPSIANRILPDGMEISASFAHRLPVALVLLQAIACLVITLRMVESTKTHLEGTWEACRKAIALTLETAKWVFTHRATCVVVMIGLSIDAVVRNFATITSSYYRLIGLPEWTFGFLGALVGLAGFVVPSIAAELNKRFGTLANLGFAAALALIGLSGIVSGNSLWCLIPAMLLMMTMGFLGFTISRSLNRESDSSRRATVLSVKGLAFNLAYGGFSLGFSRLLASNDGPGDDALRHALLWQVPFFALLTACLLMWGKWQMGKARAS